MVADPITVALPFARILEGLGIRYVVGGSVASTLYGEPRTTLDVDFALQLERDQVEPLAEELAQEFLVTTEAIEQAVSAWTSFHALHRASFIKVDAYVRPATGLFASEFERARPVVPREGPGGTALIATPEDTLLQKLRWYRERGAVPDRQWRDVLGILTAVGAQLDTGYCDRWAGELGLTELLARARREVDEARASD